MSDPITPSLYFHTFWTRPQFVDPGRTPSDPIELPDFEALTWLTSALEARRHGRIRLFTDTRGLEFIRNIGLEWVYNGGVSTGLDAVPESINPAVFWAAGKMFAWASIGEPAISLDPDAVVWQPLVAAETVVVLHPEDPQGEDYRYQRERYGRLGFDGPEWDWAVEPGNTGVLMIADPGFARCYAAEAIRFMTEFSEKLRSRAPVTDTSGEPWNDAMIFAEQRLLSMLLRRHRVGGSALASYDSRRQHQSIDSPCLHLWGTKQFYPKCRDARVAYANGLIGHLQRTFPEAAGTLARWKLDQPLRTEQMPPDPEPRFPLSTATDDYCQLGRIHGAVSIQDANLDVRRPGYPGALVGMAEILHPEPGTSFELTETRHLTSPNINPAQSFHFHAPQDLTNVADSPAKPGNDPDHASGSRCADTNAPAGPRTLAGPG